MSSSNTTITVTLSADEYTAVTEQAAKRGIAPDEYIRQAAAQRANNGRAKDRLLQETAARRGQSVEEFLNPGFLIDTDDSVDAELDRRLTAARGTQAEPETDH
ncbi:TraB/GumN family protein [Streptomyces sp. SID12501]|uniref:TraB/GumN family protein n=1 Tax=Streptomyces sp. SID12501 TaxID=2706042 RepID=A0A6B3C4S7_9ACTN|nr:TraB/GumN family protein [Streptomyces sp. SID12501]NEC91743.1 TraB/GumN family protein [Streptomyces sp. SID12501]